MENTLVSREEALEAYLRLARQAGVPPRHQPSLKRLPPFLCAALVGAGPRRLGAVRKLAGRYSGCDDAELDWIRVQGMELAWCRKVQAPHVLSLTQLTEYGILKKVGRRRALLQRALEELRLYHPTAFETVSQFTSMLVWLEPGRTQGGGGAFSSTSFYELPHCTFLCDLALFHIPSNVVFRLPSVYALQDNLYHEALHQRLIATIRCRDILDGRRAVERCPRIWIPWRRVYWTLEHSLQGGFVYLHLALMRAERCARALEGENPRTLRQAVSEAQSAATHLVKALVKRRAWFGRTGKRLLDEMQAQTARW
jgi:hypothetical protein